MRTITFSLLLASIVALAETGAAQPHDGPEVGHVQRHVDIVYYAVEGETVGDLARSLRARGPLSDEERYFGQTAWTINVEYVWRGDVTGCRVDDLVVRLLVTITLPRWEPPLSAPSELVNAWNRFLRALTRHEHNHRRLADEAADAIRWELATLRLSSCAQAEQQARERVNDIIDEYGRRNRVYDERTQHGTTEGAVWPPPTRIGLGVAGPR